MTELEFHPVADIFPMMSERELAELTDDIAKHDLREPIWLHPDGRIIDGRNRYLACRRAGLQPTLREYDGADEDLVPFVLSLNLHRRHLNESQRAMVAARVANLDRGRPSVNPPIGGISNADAAALLNVGERSVERARAVQDAGVPELRTAVESGEIAVSTAADIARAPGPEQRRVVSLDDKVAILQAAREIRRERIAEARTREPEPAVTPPLPDGKYRALVIDPPWPIEKIEREERPDQGQALDYPVMSLDEIAALPVPDLAADGCHVYLWTTHRFLPDAFKLFETWGVRYQCLMTWVKNVGITPFSWMYDTEHVLFGRIGSLKLEQLGLRLSFSAPVTRHSAKPDVFYERALAASPGPRLELFARTQRAGFDAWGNEVVGDEAV